MVHAQVSDDANVMLNGFGTVVNSLKMRAKPYLPQICGTIKWRLNNKSAKIRQQAADLIARIAVVMKVGPRPLISVAALSLSTSFSVHMFFLCCMLCILLETFATNSAHCIGAWVLCLIWCYVLHFLT